MKKIVVLSGKGGTGKTTISSSFARLMANKYNKLNIADCDVEAPNLHLMFKNELIEQKEYYGSKLATIDYNICTNCKLCYEKCRFNAITIKDDLVFINELDCEGCGFCDYICPVNAISLNDELTGHINGSKIENGYLSYANLKIGADGAGKVVTEVRQMAESYNIDSNFPYLLIDGSPGIGCVVIASLTGCDYAIVVTEPTQSGLNDLKRVLELIKFFDMPCYVIINKYDLNEEKTTEIEQYIKIMDSKTDIVVIGKIPFDKLVSESIQNETPIVAYKKSDAGLAITKAWNELISKIH
ncbi:MinD superfamily P-loop ATPase [Methanococcus voltae PS]|uniref:MinD superfamily P-loop ATPase n=1 Tax=Methanococcus voltae PS TaxID=523842 RepID=A0ABT2EZV0_METVO|nr:ATP-binding protein [Methanococcus voltae]MCS3922753.1 MinD superfamily P-loop ATPase [Methanococcus voltae PS]